MKRYLILIALTYLASCVLAQCIDHSDSCDMGQCCSPLVCKGLPGSFSELGYACCESLECGFGNEE